MKRHLERALAPDAAGDGHHRRVAEPAAAAAGRREARFLGRDGEVGAGDQLAPRGGGEAVHARDDGLRHALDGPHQLGAHAEELAHAVEIALDHVGEVVPGREDRPVGRQDHGADLRVRRQAMECVQQLPHVRFRERVPALGPVHRDGAESGVGGDDDVFVSHGDRLAAV